MNQQQLKNIVYLFLSRKLKNICLTEFLKHTQEPQVCVRFDSSYMKFISPNHVCLKKNLTFCPKDMVYNYKFGYM